MPVPSSNIQRFNSLYISSSVAYIPYKIHDCVFNRWHFCFGARRSNIDYPCISYSPVCWCVNRSGNAKATLNDGWALLIQFILNELNVPQNSISIPLVGLNSILDDSSVERGISSVSWELQTWQSRTCDKDG